jgi:hypothetical protein
MTTVLPGDDFSSPAGLKPGTTKKQKHRADRRPRRKSPASEGGRYKNKTESTGLKTGHYKIKNGGVKPPLHY